MAALYPLGLLAVSLLLATDKPLKLGLSFYAGAFASLFIVGTVVIHLLHGAGVTGDSGQDARGGFRLGLGTAMLVAAWILSRQPLPQGEKPDPSWKVRLRNATPLSVLLTGAVLYSPSGSYLGSVQQIATTNTGLPDEIQLLIVIAIVLITVEAPLAIYAIRPEPTARALRRCEAWIDRHGRHALILALTVIGSYLFVDGLLLIL
jgi:hypothetical protein